MTVQSVAAARLIRDAGGMPAPDTIAELTRLFEALLLEAADSSADASCAAMLPSLHAIAYVDVLADHTGTSNVRPMAVAGARG